MELKDLCISCGGEYERALWGADCHCSNPNVVHQEKCGGCNEIIGQITDDDYCGPEKIYCSSCLNKARVKT